MAIPIGTKCRVVVDYLMIDGSPMHSLPRGTEVVVTGYGKMRDDLVPYPYYVHGCQMMDNYTSWGSGDRANSGGSKFLDTCRDSV